MKPIVAALFFSLATPALAQPAPNPVLDAALAAMPKGARFGLVVADDTGREIVALLPDQRFMPASNTKMFTVAAALATLPDADKPDATGGTAVHLDGRDVTLVGHGDARMSGAADCVTNCLAALADAVAAKTKRVRNITGDATAWPDRRWSWGMSINNVAEQSGTGNAALVVDSNQTPLVVGHNDTGGPIYAVSKYFAIDPALGSTEAKTSEVDVDRLPFDRRVRVTGKLGATDGDQTVRLGIDDPAHYVAWRFGEMLRARGVRVSGSITSRYTPVPMAVKRSAPLAQLSPPPLVEDMVTINKISQNLHSELLLRRTGQAAGADGSVDSGVAVVGAMLAKAGVPRAAYDFSDGSGMSSYNRISPRGTVMFLRWVTTQPWAGTFRATLPIGGVDGTLARRFKGTPLEGRIFAKTGTLNATNALSGYMIAKSGRTLTFSALVNDVPADQRAVPAMDAAMVAIAEAN